MTEVQSILYTETDTNCASRLPLWMLTPQKQTAQKTTLSSENPLILWIPENNPACVHVIKALLNMIDLHHS